MELLNSLVGINKWMLILSLAAVFISSGLMVLLITGLIKLVRYLLKRFGTKDRQRQTAIISITLGEIGRWVNDVDRRIKRVGFKRVTGGKYFLVLTVGILLALWLGVFVFNNLVIAALSVVAFVLLLEQVLVMYERKQKDIMFSQMVVAIRIFAAELANTPQVERAIGAVARQCPKPLGKVFTRAYNSLMAGRSKDTVFAGMIAELNNEFGHMFVQLIRMSDRNAAVIPLFHELIYKISAFENLINENRQQVSAERKLSALMLVSPILVYFISSKLVPETNEFLLTTVAGNLIIALTMFSAIAWSILTRTTDNVENL